MANLLCRDLKTAVKTVVGSCVSLGILVESMNPVEVEKLIDEGKFDKEIKEERTKTPEEKLMKLKEFFDKLKDEQDKILKAEAAQKAEATAASASAVATSTTVSSTATSSKSPEKTPAKVSAKDSAKASGKK